MIRKYRYLTSTVLYQFRKWLHYGKNRVIVSKWSQSMSSRRVRPHTARALASSLTLPVVHAGAVRSSQAMRLLHRAIEGWYALQVELHGQYSLARLQAFHNYTQRTSKLRFLLVTVLTPAVAILLITLTDCMPLQDSTRGLAHSHVLWARAYISIYFIAGCTMVQLRYIAPGLGISLTEVFLTTLVAAAGAVLTQFGFANAIGYPVPFGLVLGTPCFIVLVAATVLPRRKLLRDKPVLRQQLGDYVTVWICEVGLTVIYPLYNYAFSKVTSQAQNFLVLLLPIIKLANKNWISYSLRDMDDMKPDVVIFNIEVFHALYVSLCMQASSSYATTVTIMAIDFLQAWVSFRDVESILQEINDLLKKVPPVGRPVSFNLHSSDEPTQMVTIKARSRNILEAAVAVLEEDAVVRQHKSMRMACFDSSSLSRRLSSNGGVPTTKRMTRMYKPKSSRVIAVTGLGATDGTESSKGSHGSGLTAEERLLLVQKTIHVLFVTEFLVLVEYTEVMVPFIYNVCVVGMINLPNRMFYPLLSNKTDEQLTHMIRSVSVYGMLEFISFVAFCLLLRCKLRTSLLAQVAFVLENQWVSIQSKIIMWVFYVIQTSLYHFGADFSFSFRWLHIETPT